jgi:hypothetical protein
MKTIIKIRSEKDIIELLETHSDSERVYIRESGEIISLSELLFGYDGQDCTVVFQA